MTRYLNIPYHWLVVVYSQFFSSKHDKKWQKKGCQMNKHMEMEMFSPDYFPVNLTSPLDWLLLTPFLTFHRVSNRETEAAQASPRHTAARWHLLKQPSSRGSASNLQVFTLQLHTQFLNLDCLEKSRLKLFRIKFLTLSDNNVIPPTGQPFFCFFFKLFLNRTKGRLEGQILIEIYQCACILKFRPTTMRSCRRWPGGEGDSFSLVLN